MRRRVRKPWLSRADARWADPATCFSFVAERRWPGGAFRCSRCDHTRAYARSKRVGLQCVRCATIHGLRVGTLMEGSHLSLGVWLACASAVAAGRVRATKLHQSLKTTGVGPVSYEGVKGVVAVLRGRAASFRPQQLQGPVHVDVASVRRRTERVAIAVEDRPGGRARVGLVHCLTDLTRFLRKVVRQPYSKIYAGPGIRTLAKDAFVHRFWRGRLQRQRADAVRLLDGEITELAATHPSVKPYMGEFEFRLAFRGQAEAAIDFLLDLPA